MLQYLLGWIRTAVRDAFLGGIKDATDVLTSDEDTKGLAGLRSKLAGILNEEAVKAIVHNAHPEPEPALEPEPAETKRKAKSK